MTGLRAKARDVLKGPIGGMLLCLLIAGFLGGVAMADPGGVPNEHASASASPSDEPTEAPESPQPDQSSSAPASPAGQQTHTAADCQAALSQVQSQLPVATGATGLANAIWTVEGNCEKNPQAPGLLIALQHLTANYQKHLTHETEKAAAGHGASSHDTSSHGSSGEHGPDAPHGASGVHGSSGS